MLQRGFLKPSVNEKEAQAGTIARVAMFAGILFVILAVCGIIVFLQRETGSLALVLGLFIMGFISISISFWMNFFAKRKV